MELSLVDENLLAKLMASASSPTNSKNLSWSVQQSTIEALSTFSSVAITSAVSSSEIVRLALIKVMLTAYHCSASVCLTRLD